MLLHFFCQSDTACEQMIRIILELVQATPAETSVAILQWKYSQQLITKAFNAFGW
jgi:hypothetical protein